MTLQPPQILNTREIFCMREIFCEIVKEAKTSQRKWTLPYQKDENGTCIPVWDVLPDIAESHQCVLLLAWKAEAAIQQGNNGASYDSHRDIIQIPNARCFKNQDDCYSCILHELGHWTNHPKRLKRTKYPHTDYPPDRISRIRYRRNHCRTHLCYSRISFQYPSYGKPQHLSGIR